MTRRQHPRETGFQFEAGTVSLTTGAIFRPARQSVDRWVVEQPAAFAAAETHYHCLRSLHLCLRFAVAARTQRITPNYWHFKCVLVSQHDEEYSEQVSR